MAKMILTALPSHYEVKEGSSFKMQSFAIGSGTLGRTTIEAKNVEAVRNAVRAFGHSIATERPNVSFDVSVTVAAGSRSPAGFDKAAYKERSLGADTWMQTITKA